MSLHILQRIIHSFYEDFNDQVIIEKQNLIPETKHNLQESLKEFKSSEKFLQNCSYILKFKSTHFSIILVNDSNDAILNLRIVKLCKRIEFLYKHLGIQKIFNIWIIPLSNKRLFPNQKQEITVNNINGGFTYTNGNDIYVHKEEEFPKVTIHEFLHHTFFDTSDKWSSENIQNLKDIFDISDKSNFLPNEAIIELWAEVFQLLFISEELYIPFYDLYKNELLWGIHQSNNLLKHQDTLYLDEWNEKTNAYSYIIIKTIILNNLDEFIKIQTPYNTALLSQFISYSYKLLIPKLEQFENETKKNNNKKSLRMTIYGDL